jgi:toxin-antitoxin system PIN domain toxin
VTARLLDTNVLLALAWPSHALHAAARRWWASLEAARFATCPLTEIAFVRISSNPSFTRDAVLPGEALGLLASVTALPRHAFWPDDLPACDGLRRDLLLLGHRQVTDAYLVALATRHEGLLSTFDKGVAAAAGPHRASVELIPI